MHTAVPAPADSNRERESTSSRARPAVTHRAVSRTILDVGIPNVCLQSATAGDHPLIHRFLMSIFHCPSIAEMHAQLEDPLYEPSQRLVVKMGSQLIGHTRYANRELQFGSCSLPTAIVADVAVQPEWRMRGVGRALLSTAETHFRGDGATLGLLRTRVPGFFLKQGWVVCGRHSYSLASPRDILAWLSSQQSESRAAESVLPRTTAKPISVRLWRHVEQAALTRLYQQNAIDAQSGPLSYGALVRNDAYWRWLIGRRGQQRIYVAIEGPDKLELDDEMAAIVGYAVTRDGRLAEIECVAGHERASTLR